MNEMQLLEEFRAVVAPPDLGTLAQARARMLTGAAAGQSSRRARWRHWPGGWPKLALAGLAGVAMATAVTVAVAVPGGRPPHGGTAGLTAKELAYRVAGAAAAQPSVRPGQWVYRQVKSVNPNFGNMTGPQWATADGTKNASQYNNKGKVHIEHCPLYLSLPHGCRADMYTPDDVGIMPVTYAGLSALPRSPAALTRYLASIPLHHYLDISGYWPAPYREFTLIGALLWAYVMPPALTAECYRALSNIPGVTADRHAVDVAGRAGIGFQITAPRLPTADAPVRSVDQIILDPKTYDLMAIQRLSINQRVPSVPRRSLYGSAILESALVSGPGIRP